MGTCDQCGEPCPTDTAFCGPCAINHYDDRRADQADDTGWRHP